MTVLFGMRVVSFTHIHAAFIYITYNTQPEFNVIYSQANLKMNVWTGRRRRLIRGESPRSKGRTSFEVPPEKNFPLKAMHPLQWKTTSIEVNPLE